MGADPERSITDAYGKFHSVDGLYCADGALFTTSTGMNPALTIWALARRVGRGILGRR
jgi:choline dehydrogenase-like flavoprotein